MSSHLGYPLIRSHLNFKIPIPRRKKIGMAVDIRVNIGREHCSSHKNAWLMRKGVRDSGIDRDLLHFWFWPGF
jgi:hypothetical protein